MAATGRRKAAQKAKQTRKIIIFAVEIVIILIMLGVLWIVSRTPSEGPKRIEPFNPQSVGVNSRVQQDKESGESTMLGYMNVALFGVDARTDNELYKDSRSDSMMIASINLDTGEIKLVSVYRDTMLYLCQDKYPYQKCNAAYFYGGAEQAVTMLNTNLDMDIETFVTVNYKALTELIDALGGVWLTVGEVELAHINNYQMDIAKVLKCEYVPVTKQGYQKLNGLQATAFCRIRYGLHNDGSDFQRTTRQRAVIRAIEKEAKTKDLATLQRVFEAVIKDVYTNISDEQILKLLTNISKYHIADEENEDANGFPQKNLRTVVNLDNIDGWAVGSTIVPTDLEANVVWLHKFLFDDQDYVVTDTVKKINQTIKDKTQKYINSRQ